MSDVVDLFVVVVYDLYIINRHNDRNYIIIIKPLQHVTRQAYTVNYDLLSCPRGPFQSTNVSTNAYHHCFKGIKREGDFPNFQFQMVVWTIQKNKISRKKIVLSFLYMFNNYWKD